MLETRIDNLQARFLLLKMKFPLIFVFCSLVLATVGATEVFGEEDSPTVNGRSGEAGDPSDSFWDKVFGGIGWLLIIIYSDILGWIYEWNKWRNPQVDEEFL